MSTRFRAVAGPIVAAVAAGWWVVAMSVQTAAEPFGYAENNTYWLRDVRWLALLAIAVAAVWTFRGDAFVSTVAAFGYAVSTVVDAVVDRMDALWAQAAILLWIGVWVWGYLRRTRPGNRTLLLASVIAATGAVGAAALQSPTDLEWSLNPSAVLLCVLLAVCAMVCAFDVAGAAGRYRAAVSAAMLAVGGVCLVVARMESPKFSFAAAALIAVLFTGVTVVLLGEATSWPLRIGLGLFNGFIAMCVLLFATVVSVVLQPGAPYTLLAGNPVIGGDEDVVMTLAALVTGIAVAAIVVIEHASVRNAAPTPAGGEAGNAGA